jgi:hypothetical protein
MYETFLGPQEKHSSSNCTNYKYQTAQVGSTAEMQNFSKVNEDLQLN